MVKMVQERASEIRFLRRQVNEYRSVRDGADGGHLLKLKVVGSFKLSS